MPPLAFLLNKEISMDHKKKFDALQERISKLLSDCESARLQTCQEGAAYFFAGIMVGLANSMAFDALRILRKKERTQCPSFSEVGYDEFMELVTALSTEKKISREHAAKALTLATEVVLEQAEANLWKANFAMLEHTSGLHRSQFED